ncbi:hypothetical protein [Pedobacter sp. NJ-S-72]
MNILIFMKKSIYFVCLVMTAFCCNACRDKSSAVTDHSNQDSSLTVTAAKIMPADTGGSEYEPVAITEEQEGHIVYTDSVDFKKYVVEIPSKSVVKAEIDWSGNLAAKTFRTRITDGYNGQEVDFAGHYIGIVFGCGGGCILGFMVDVRDGKIYDLPLGEENMCVDMQDAALYRAGSILFISAVCKQDPKDSKVFYKAYLWDEQNKRFNPVGDKDFLRKVN